MTPDDTPDIAALNAEGERSPAVFRGVTSAVRLSMSGVTDSVRSATAEITRANEAGKTLSTALSSGLDTAFRSAIKDGAKLSDILRNLALDVSRSVASRAIGGLTSQITDGIGNAAGQGAGGLLSAGIGGLFDLLPFAKGAAFDAGKIRAFAKGGVVSGPTLFPMHGATGLMGEAGPEAILPLHRTPDGRLGVASGQGGASSVTVNIMTQDADSFARSRTQIAATLARAVDRGRRNL